MSEESQQLLSCLPSLRRYARALVGERDAADDLVQDTIERAWRKLSSWQHGGNMRAWLFSIMHNLHIDQYRKPAIATDAMNEHTPEPATNSDYTTHIQLHEMDAALAMLPLEQREVLLLVALEQMTYDEVALTLNIPTGTVMSRLSRGRERLRRELDVDTGRPALKVVR